MALSGLTSEARRDASTLICDLPTLSPSVDATRPRLFAAALLLALLTLPSHLSSDVIVVDGTCSMADAIQAANTDSPAGGCPAGSGADELQLTGDVMLTEPLPRITTSMTVSGDEFSIERSAVADPFRIFRVSGGDFTLESVRVSNGDASESAGGAILFDDDGLSLTVSESTLSGNSAISGGAIYAYNDGVLLVNSTISGNSAVAGHGGGIWALGGLEIVNSRIDGNEAKERGGGIEAWHHLDVTEGSSVNDNVAGLDGGGISVKEWAKVDVVDSSVSYNIAGGSGGGIYMAAVSSYAAHELSLTNATLAGNYAGNGGGALTLDVGYVYFSDAPITVSNSTISGNTAGARGGGLEHKTGQVILTNTTVTGNSAPAGSGVELTASTDFELIGSIVAGNLQGESCSGTGVDGADIQASFDDDGSCGSAAPIVPGVDFDTALQDNGGPTATHALLTNSVAIDAAGDCGLPTDQRGFERDAGACDSGAFEFGVGPFPLSLQGECPGTVTASVVAAVPGALVRLIHGPAPGVSQVPAGLCQGTPVDLVNPSLLTAFLADENGAGTVVLDVVESNCRRFVQALDEGDCDVSTIQRIDSCHPLAFVHSGSGSDPIPSIPGSPGCPEGEYLSGTLVDLTAIPDPDWSVASWSGTDDDASMSETNTVTMPAADHVVGVTYELACAQLELLHTGEGADPTASPLSSPGCEPGEYNAGELITLTAAAAVGWDVAGWSGTDDDLSTEPTNFVTFPGQPHTVEVFYAELCFDLSLNHAGSGEDPLVRPLGVGLLWTEQTVDDGFTGAVSVYAADVDDDGDVDILGAAKAGHNVSWWENTLGTGTAWVQHVVDSAFFNAMSVHAADVDGDGDTDVLAASVSDQEIAWWENVMGDGSVWVKQTVGDDFESAYSVYAADVDGDGDTDVLGAAFGDFEIVWWENTAGDGTRWIEHIVAPSFAGPTSVSAADIDGDGDIDVLGSGDLAGSITWWENSLGDGTVWTEYNIADYERPFSAHADDVDGDGDIDVLGASFGSRGITWWENSLGDGSLWVERAVDGQFVSTSVYTEDIDGDGDADILGASPSFSDITWWENTLGDGTDWLKRTVDGFFDGASSVFAADVDGDGAPDMLGAAETANEITWWRNTDDGQCPAGAFHFGDRLGLLATPDPGWEVGGWAGTDDDMSTETTNTATMPANAHEIAVDYLSIDPFHLEIIGTCPGEITIAVAGVSPNTNVSFISSDLEGVFVKPQPPCQGLELGLAAPDLVTSVPADANGDLMLTPDVSSDVCGKFVQAVEIDLCSVSEVAQIP